MQGSCAGKIALVVGGTRGIGRAAALALAGAGATVMPSGRKIEAAQAVAEDIRKAGGTAHPVSFDVADAEASAAAVSDIVARFGRIDVLVANAGINPYWKRAETLTPAMWDEVMAVNLRGVFFAVQAVGKQMLAQGSGSIVSISSVTATTTVPRGLPYIATKGGMDSMTRALAVEWGPRGVRVNGVAPGYIATDLTHGLRDNAELTQSLLKHVPLGRFGTPEEIASIIVMLASDASAYVTGQTFIVDGGFAAGRNTT